MTPTPPHPDRAQSNESVPEIITAAYWKSRAIELETALTKAHSAIDALQAVGDHAAPPVSQRATGEEELLLRYADAICTNFLSNYERGKPAWQEAAYLLLKDFLKATSATPRSLPHGPGDASILAQIAEECGRMIMLGRFAYEAAAVKRYEKVCELLEPYWEARRDVSPAVDGSKGA